MEDFKPLQHPEKLNDPIIGHPAMKGRRWTIDYGYEPHSSYAKLQKHLKEFIMSQEKDKWDIDYKDFYSDLNEANIATTDNNLIGGVGDSTDEHTVNPVQLSLGIQVEMEHTNNPDIAREIALDHLKEDPEYYTKLIRCGLAKEFQPGAASGLGDPNQSFNDPARVGNTGIEQGNVQGTIGDTSNGQVDGRNSQPIIDKGISKTEIDIQEPTIDEEKKKKDRCHKKADSVYGPKTSAYKSGAIVKCRQGKIWKKKQEESAELEEKKDFSKEKSQGLHGWFARRGGRGGKGWVDCNTCRKDPKTGTKKCKSCGRQTGEKRSKYPACRPTPSQCNKTGTSKKKGPSSVSWQKKKNESIEYKNFFENAEITQSDLTKIIDYSEKLQSMFNVNDNLEDWVKAKLNHACDYVATVRDYLKFYNEEKDKTNIQEKWSIKYKKSIDCGNPNGFSQKAHCAARRKRQAGGKTSSKSINEIYKEVYQELLREFNSSMAMGTLKQINSDAKELQSLFTDTASLEDWVKAKLNLAGEYLDDVYHHLDHFGPEGRKYDRD
jgi:hypothetical protein